MCSHKFLKDKEMEGKRIGWKNENEKITAQVGIEPTTFCIPGSYVTICATGMTNFLQTLTDTNRSQFCYSPNPPVCHLAKQTMLFYQLKRTPDDFIYLISESNCSRFHILMLEAESVPVLWRHHTSTRESRATRRSPRVFLSARPTTKSTADQHCTPTSARRQL